MGIDLGKFTRKKNGVGSSWEQLGRGGSCPEGLEFLVMRRAGP